MPRLQMEAWGFVCWPLVSLAITSTDNNKKPKAFAFSSLEETRTAVQQEPRQGCIGLPPPRELGRKRTCRSWTFLVGSMSLLVDLGDQGVEMLVLDFLVKDK